MNDKSTFKITSNIVSTLFGAILILFRNPVPDRKICQ